MHFDLPDFRRCCCCFSLRHGILVYGYLNLAFSLLLLFIEVAIDFGLRVNNTLSVFRGVELFAHLWIHLFLDALEIIFNIILLVGAHRKNIRLIRIYYYYGILTTIAASLLYIVVTIDSPIARDIDYIVLSLCLAFSGFVLQAYLLLLIRSELKKLKSKEAYKYVNHMTEIILNQPEEIIT